MLIYWKILEICLTVVVWTMNELSKTLVETKLTFFVKIVHADGGIENGEISMNLNDQCRVCNCSFKVKFVFLIRLKESDLKGEVLKF